MESTIRFLSLNVGLKNNVVGLESLLRVHNLDIILLQEVRISDDLIDIIVGKHGYKGKVNINPEEPSVPGTAIVWRSCLPVSRSKLSSGMRSNLRKYYFSPDLMR